MPSPTAGKSLARTWRRWGQAAGMTAASERGLAAQDIERETLDLIQTTCHQDLTSFLVSDVTLYVTYNRIIILKIKVLPGLMA